MHLAFHGRVALALALILSIGSPALAQAPVPVASPSPSSTLAPIAPGLYLPPAGWTRKDASINFGRADVKAIWMPDDPAHPGENINLTASPVPPAIDNATVFAMAGTELGRLVGPGNLIASRAEKICNGKTEGWYLESSMVFGAITVDLVQVAGIANGLQYVVTYTRRKGDPIDASARASLDTLCPSP